MNHPTLNYVELPATDLAATKAFYTDAFGWAWTDYGPTYASADASGLEVGLTTEAAPAPTPTDDDESSIGPLLLFQSHELDDALASVTAGGGRIVTQPFDYPGGRRFHFSDPSGNVLGVDRPDTA